MLNCVASLKTENSCPNYVINEATYSSLDYVGEAMELDITKETA